MDILIKIAAVAVAGTIFSLVIKKNSPEMALMLTIALAIAAFCLAFDMIKSIAGFITSVADASSISPSVLSIVFKAIGISIVTKLASDVCKDAGQSSIASGVEMTGAFAALYISLPLMQTVIGMIETLA